MVHFSKVIDKYLQNTAGIRSICKETSGFVRLPVLLKISILRNFQSEDTRTIGIENVFTYLFARVLHWILFTIQRTTKIN